MPSWLGFSLNNRNVLQEATELSDLFNRIHTIFASGDLGRISQTLASMRRSISLVQDVPEFRDSQARLQVLVAADEKPFRGSAPRSPCSSMPKSICQSRRGSCLDHSSSCEANGGSGSSGCRYSKQLPTPAYVIVLQHHHGQTTTQRQPHPKRFPDRSGAIYGRVPMQQPSTHHLAVMQYHDCLICQSFSSGLVRFSRSADQELV